MPYISRLSALGFWLLATLLYGVMIAVLLLPATAKAQDAADPLATDPAFSVEAVMNESRANAGGSVRPPPSAAEGDVIPTAPGQTRPRDFGQSNEAALVEALNAQGLNSSSAIWGEVRAGEQFVTQASNPQSAFLIQDDGVAWQILRSAEGALREYGTLALFAVIALLFVFYLLRGRVEVEHGLAGVTIERFKAVERFGHWLLAISFILLALTGLNLLYGRDVLLPVLGKEAFATFSQAGKWVHNNVAWAFMVSLVWITVTWVAHNLPSKHDLKWLALGGGLFVKGVHPPSRKFNAGQKLIFWSTVVLGASVSASGVMLLFPYDIAMFAGTFETLNAMGAMVGLTLGLPTTLSPLQEVQYAQAWHTIVAFAMIAIIVAHIYIGSVGMQGAFDAMGDGHVDRNWALEHHSLWVEEEEAKARGEMSGRPARGAAPGMATPAE